MRRKYLEALMISIDHCIGNLIAVLFPKYVHDKKTPEPEIGPGGLKLPSLSSYFTGTLISSTLM